MDEITELSNVFSISNNEMIDGFHRNESNNINSTSEDYDPKRLDSEEIEILFHNLSTSLHGNDTDQYKRSIDKLRDLATSSPEKIADYINRIETIASNIHNDFSLNVQNIQSGYNEFNLNNLKNEGVSIGMYLYDKIYHSCDNIEKFFLLFGLFYCLLSMKLPKISIASLIFLLVFSFILRCSKYITFIVNTIDSFVRNIFPNQILTLFADEKEMIGVIVISIVISCFLLFLLSWFQIVAAICIMYCVYLSFETTFNEYFQNNSKIYCAIFSIIVAIVFHFMQVYILRTLVGLFTCFLGSIILLILFSKKFSVLNGYGEFYLKILNLQQEALHDLFLYSTLSLAFTAFYIQKTLLKA